MYCTRVAGTLASLAEHPSCSLGYEHAFSRALASAASDPQALPSRLCFDAPIALNPKKACALQTARV